MNTELNLIDMQILEYLYREPGFRNIRQNISYDLYNTVNDDSIDVQNPSDTDKEKIENFAERLGNRVSRMIDDGLIERVGPAPNSGLYQLTDPGHDAAEIISQHDIHSENERTKIRYQFNTL